MKLGQSKLARLFSLKHSKTAYLADFGLLFFSVVGLAVFLAVDGGRERRSELAVLGLIGLGSWTLIEYLSHRFVLHGIAPFRHWHALHHQRPTDLIYAPTIVSITPLVGFVFLPAWLLGDLRRACALMLGLLVGYFGYSITHHAVHYWSCNSAWLTQRKRWHSLHHRPSHRPGRYGVTTALWDYVFRSVP